MAERVLFNIVEEIVQKLGPLATQEIAIWWGLNGQLSKLMSTVTRIKAVIHDAEKRVQKLYEQLEDWLEKLQEAVYDAEDLFDDFSIKVQRKRFMSQKKISREVRTFFSVSNQFVYGCKKGHKVKELRERLDDIFEESEKFHFEVRYEENASLTVVRKQTTSAEPESIFGRDDDRKKVISFLLNSNYDKESVSVISLVGMGGLGKTTLAQHVYNDEQVNSHFGIKLSMRIDRCPKLSSMLLFLTLDDELYLSQTSSVLLQKTMKMRGWKSTSSEASSSSFVHPLSKLKALNTGFIEDMESLLEDVLKNLSSLQQLSIWNCPRVKALHPPDQGMHSLQKLRIWYCGELRSLSESQSQGIPNLPSLQELIICRCGEELSGRLREGKEAVEYWPNINHIPNIMIDGYYIQMDGCYVKEEKLR